MTKETTIIVCPNCMRGFEIEGKIILDVKNTKRVMEDKKDE